MDLYNYLDKLTPKRWVLIIRNYLFWFKKPAPFYFKLRAFINKIKKQSKGLFDFNSLIELLTILEEKDNDKNAILEDLKNKIITRTAKEKVGLLNEKNLETLLVKFDTDNYTVNKFLGQLPLTCFSNYISRLSNNLSKGKNTPHYYIKQLKWTIRLNDKFSSIAKLRLLLSMPESLVSEIGNELKLIAIETVSNNLSTLKNLGLNVKVKFFQFITLWKDYLHVSNKDYFNFLDTIFLENSESVSIILYNFSELDYNEKIIFLQKILNYTTKAKKTLIENLFKAYPEEEKPQLINWFITNNFQQPDNSVTFLLNQLHNEETLNLFQTLAIQTLTKSIDLNKIKEILTTLPFLPSDLNNDYFLSLMEDFSTEIQVLVVEATITELQNYMSDKIIFKLARKPEKFNLHTLWYRFQQDEWTYASSSYVKQFERILEKIPSIEKENERVTINFLKQLYELLDTPKLRNLSDEKKSNEKKQAIECTIKFEERREFTYRIALGMYYKVSYQRMEEIFGSNAEQMQNTFSKKFGTVFFDARNPDEYKGAQFEVEQLKEFKNLAFF
ncbi:MAG: hypothetical protein REH83_05035 [Rickettsiella sp.]|nr:hypothetical protein [Rickettsiella sp.]